ncbi:actin family, Ankyrin repeat-containing domain protein [Artemisia annua]|uniref:Actin family, Ankyrin repeat-containing domain protein n=1 Tax=Artemisia annua TaxID=35608 RepID=A0A2U1LBC8_ARTAN|nr:actin family, Ankyrin repeat-containing domain protein [Artemisia annua]
MTYEYAKTDPQIYRAALHDNWDDVCGLFRERPELMTKPVNERLETPLMIAVGTNSSHEYIKQLLNNVKTYHDHDKWCGVNNSGNNALHYAAKVGNMIDAIHMVRCLPGTMTIVKNIHGDTPLLLAAKLGRKDMIDEVFKKYTITLDDETVNLIIPAIQAGLLDLALVIVYLSPPDEITPNALEALATKPEFFPSGNRLGFCGGLTYHSSAAPLALTDKDSTDEKKERQDEPHTGTTLLLPPNESTKGIKLPEDDLQPPNNPFLGNEASSEASAAPLALTDKDSTDEKKERQDEPHTATTLLLPPSESTKGIKLPEDDLQPPNNPFLGNEASSAVPGTPMQFIQQETLPPPLKEKGLQESKGKTVKRPLFQQQPAESKKQKGTHRIFN